MSHSDPTTAIYFRYRRGVLRYLAHAIGSTERAEDLCQEVFLRIVRGLGGYREAGLEAAWVFRIARNVLLDATAEESRAASVEQAGEVPEEAQPPVQALRMSLAEALAALPSVNRDLLLLREVAGLSHAEIAAATGLTASAVRCRLGRTRAWLQEHVIYERPAGFTARRRGEDHED